MVTARSTKSPRILMSRLGNGRPLTPLIDGLRRQGYDVLEQESATIGAHSTGRSAQDVLNNVDMAFVVVRERDGLDTGGAIRPFQKILREAGLMQGKIGMERVVLLVENTVDGLTADSGVPSVRFPADRPGLVLNDVVNKIGAAFPSEERDLHERVPIPQQARSSELRVLWRLIGVVLLAALIPFVVAMWALFGPSNGDDEVATMSNLSSALGGAVAPPSTDDVGVGSPPAAPSESLADDAAAPALDALPGASNESFPATCRLDLRKDLLLEDAIDCDGAGGVSVIDRLGPWHNDLAAVVLGDGVVGELRYEAGGVADAEGQLIALSAGLVPLDLAAASYGVEAITLWFSGNNQHVHLLSDLENGDTATLTFSLDG